jgi:hypothetical protein
LSKEFTGFDWSFVVGVERDVLWENSFKRKFLCTIFRNLIPTSEEENHVSIAVYENDRCLFSVLYEIHKYTLDKVQRFIMWLLLK